MCVIPQAPEFKGASPPGPLTIIPGSSPDDGNILRSFYITGLSQSSAICTRNDFCRKTFFCHPSLKYIVVKLSVLLLSYVPLKIATPQQFLHFVIMVIYKVFVGIVLHE